MRLARTMIAGLPPLALLACLLLPVPAAAAGGECMNTYYKTRDPACADTLVVNLRPSKGEAPGQENLRYQGIVGFLAEVFRSSPQDRQRLLDMPLQPHVRLVVIEALLRAGLADEASRYARAAGLEPAFKRLAARNLPRPEQVRPRSSSADNDLLIGAFMATGDTRLLHSILANYADTTDAMASDALRMGLLNARYGGRLAPKDRPPTTAKAACRKYGCAGDQARILRLVTLSSGFWALTSIGLRDETVHATLQDFFVKDARLKRLLQNEQVVFVRYVDLLEGKNARKGDPAVEAFLSGFENLRPAQELLTLLQRKGQ